MITLIAPFNNMKKKVKRLYINRWRYSLSFRSLISKTRTLSNVLNVVNSLDLALVAQPAEACKSSSGVIDVERQRKKKKHKKEKG